MGAGTPTPQTAAAGDHHHSVGPDPAAPDGASPACRQGLGLGAALAKTIAHFFPEFFAWLGDVRDLRNQEMITYPRRFLLWMGLLAFLLKLGSRRQTRFELDSPAALANLNQLAQTQLETLAHSDTLNYFLGKVPPAALARLRRQMVQRLVRMKALDSARLFGHFLVVIDATRQLFFRQRHCPRCLEQVHDQQTLYFHHVLEAKLVTPDGLAISLDSEFIENLPSQGDAPDPKPSARQKKKQKKPKKKPDPKGQPRHRKGQGRPEKPPKTPQDCELKAFGRLAARLKKDYPQLPLCLGLDGLYANGTTLEICRGNHWKYFITFKEGSLPALWTEYQALLKQCPKNRQTHYTPDEDVLQKFAWVEQLEHVDDRKRRHTVNAFQCHERKGGQTTFFAWLTNFHLTPDNVAALANRGGRCRWKIENEGFNLQKNGGFNLEHAYSTGEWQIKGFYILLQIAHLLLQLLEKGSLLTQEAKKLFGSLRGMARRLLESIRNVLIPAEALDLALAAKIQIRLNSS